MAKSFFIIGNWKMNPATKEEAKEIFASIRKTAMRLRRARVIIFPPAVFLSSLESKKNPVYLGIQDIDKDISGARTGAISAKMAKSVGARYVIVGHSERRALGDSDIIVAEKFNRAIEAGLIPILCIGEKKRDQDGDYFSEITRELSTVLKSVIKTSAPKFMVAYEPVWAVGGAYDNALSSEEMRAMTIFIKKTCADYMPKEKALRTPVLYGGSVDAENAKLMLSHGDIDGLLIGRQSLDAGRFSEIIKFADAPNLI